MIKQQPLEKTVRDLHIGPWLNTGLPMPYAFVYDGKPTEGKRIGELIATRVQSPSTEERYKLQYRASSSRKTHTIGDSVLKSSLDTEAMRFLKEHYS